MYAEYVKVKGKRYLEKRMDKQDKNSNKVLRHVMKIEDTLNHLRKKIDQQDASIKRISKETEK
jgi:septal ring factor EnvC (AmiA/AmiB activator)